MPLLRKPLSQDSCKTWMIACPESKEALLIDPVVDRALADVKALRNDGFRLIGTLDTHTHADHVSGSTLIQKTEHVPYFMSDGTHVKTVTERLKEGAVVKVGRESLRVLKTPGHTKDSITLVGNDLLVTGDFLFLGEGGAGRTDLLGGDAGEHWDSLQKLKELPDHLAVLPGHDYRGGTTGVLGEERRKNPRLAARSRAEYVQWLSAQKLEPAEWMFEVLKANVQGVTERGSLPIPEGGACCEVRGGMAQPATGLVSVTVSDLAARLESPTSQEFAVLDVREPHEFLGPLGHVPGAMNLSVQRLSAETESLASKKNMDLYVICLSGGRSVRAAEILHGAGFTRVLNVSGGMRAWVQSGLPQEFTAEKP